MRDITLPKIDYNNFAQTRDTIQKYAQLLSAIKGKLVPHQKNWEEYSLNIYAKGFTTSPIPIETSMGIEALDLNLNLIEHKLKISYKDNRDEINLEQSTNADFTKKLLDILTSYEIELEKQDENFFSEEKLIYDRAEVAKLWNLFRQIDFLFLELRGSTLFEASNINFWPHHFDLALLLFSGKIIDGQDKSNWNYSREQMNFGLSSGDGGIQQPYFYVTAYPFNKTIMEIDIPEFAEWHTEGWNGLVIKLDKLVNKKENISALLNLFTELLRENYE